MDLGVDAKMAVAARERQGARKSRERAARERHGASESSEREKSRERKRGI